MNTRLWFIVGGVGVLVVAVFFTMRPGQIKTVSVTDDEASTVISAEMSGEETSSDPVPTEQPQENMSDVVDPEVGADAVAGHEVGAKEAPKQEVAKEAVLKVPDERTKSETKLSVRDKLVNFGFAVPRRSRTIDTIILHSSYDALGDDPYSISGIIKEYEDAGVAAHYLIGRDGTIYRLVKEENVAYHAGVSRVPDGRTDVNGFSIGIEMVNTLNGKFTDEQYAAVKRLIKDIKSRRVIKYVLGHDDIAPDRKTDPWNFDWKRL